jgi:hypothetical protein
MYRVATTHLGPDARRISLGGETMDRGEMGAADLTVLLDAFVEIDPAENEEHDPNVVVEGRGAKLIIRTSRGRLQVYDVRDHAAPGIEMTVAGILERLDRALDSNLPLASEGEQPAPTAPHRGIAFAMLLVGLALNGYILYSVFYVESVNKKPEVNLLSDAEDVKARETALAGTYATGAKTGDRVIELTAAGQVHFYEIGSKGPINDSKDSFVIGRHDGQLCLALTNDVGVIDLVGETLVYYKDVYQRRHASP